MSGYNEGTGNVAFSDYDFVVCGTGSGGGLMVRRLVQAGFRVLALEAGIDYTPEIRRKRTTQEFLDEEFTADWPQVTEPEISGYGIELPPNDQSMGKMVGGSSHHFGLICYQATPEDYDEWDYLFMNGSTGLTGTLTMNGTTTVAGAGTAFQDELEPGDWIQLDDKVGGGTGAPYLYPPFQVVSIESDTSLTIAPSDQDPVVGIPTSGPVAAHRCSKWNRSAMLQHYKAVEFDVDAYLGNMPASSVGCHGLDDTEQEMGRIGSIDPGDLTDFTDTRPGVTTARINPSNFLAAESLTNSVVGGPAWTFVADRNNWDPQSGKPGGYTAPQIHKAPLDYVGFDSLGNPIVGGRQTIAHTHLDKYDERRSTLIVHIDRVRQKKLAGVYTFDGTTTVLAGAGADLAEVKPGDHIRLDTQATNYKIATVGGSITLEDTFSLSFMQVDAVPQIGDTIVLEDSGGGTLATLTAVTGAPAADQFQVAGAGAPTTAKGIALEIVRAANAGTFATYVTAEKKGEVVKFTSVEANEPGGLAGDTMNVALTGVDMSLISAGGIFSGAKAIPAGTGECTANANLTLWSGATVDKLIFHRRVTAGEEAAELAVQKVVVEKIEHGRRVKKEVYANKVILAAGPYGTPGILLRSGVGAVDRLKGAEFEIPQVLDLPGVGADALQHTISGFVAFGSPSDEPSIYHSLVYGGQFRSSSAGGGAASRSKFAVGDPAILFDEDPEVQVFFSVGGWNNLGIARTNLFGWGLAAKQGRKNYRRNYVAIGANFKPRSRGDGVRLRSMDPNDPYEIRHGVFADPDAKDAEACAEATVNIHGKLADAGVVGGLIDGGFINFGAPPGTVEAVHAGAGGAFHVVSTLKMGVPGAAPVGAEAAIYDRACLDQDAKLLGAEGVWACDNSIMPTHVRANPHQPTMAHSDLIAKHLIEDYLPFGR